uniref:Uncharacterized protein n=1 Tax=Strigamia maritima TaxID=126957 RepID=T1IT95_STRMM
MFRATLCFLYILPILAHDIRTCLQHTDDFHHADLTFVTDNFKLIPELNVKITNEDIYYQSRKCIALDIKDPEQPSNTYQPKKLNKKHRFIHVYLEDVWQEYSVKREYRFAQPKVSANCKCYCSKNPQCGNYYELDSKYNTPNIDNGEWNDVMKYGIYRHEGYACKWDDKRYQGSVCCNVTVKGAFEDTLDAIRFEMGRAYYDVRVDLIDKSGEVNGVPVRFSTDTFSIPFKHLSGALTILDYGEFQKLPPQWGSIHPERPSVIKINSMFNDVEETSVEKIGWYKWTSERQFRAPDQTAIRDAFKVEVHDCQDNKLDWNFHARGWEKHADSGDLLTDYYADIIEMVEYNSERKVVIIRHREKPRIRVNVNLKIKFEDILELKYSNYVSYEARFDSNENELLVDIQDAYGKLKLIVRSHNGTESLLTRTFLVPTLSSLNYTKTFDLSELEEWNECLVACLSTVGRSPKLQKCKKLFKTPVDFL